MRYIFILYLVTFLSFDISKTDSIALRFDIQPYTMENSNQGKPNSLPFSSFTVMLGYSIKF